MTIEFEKIYHDGWTINVHYPANRSKSRVLLMLHGLSGDENSMVIFSRNLPPDMTIFSPRAPYPIISGGFSWAQIDERSWATFEDLKPQAGELVSRLQKWTQGMHGNEPKINIIGFSQGAAMAYTMAVEYSEKVDKVACLAGFLPRGIEDHIKTGNMIGVRFLVSHGTLDSIVPVQEAVKAVSLLREVGARVNFCESPTGHKLGPECYKTLVALFRRDQKED